MCKNGVCVCVPGQYPVRESVGVELSGQSRFPELFKQPNQIMGIQLKRLPFKREITHITCVPYTVYDYTQDIQRMTQFISFVLMRMENAAPQK